MKTSTRVFDTKAEALAFMEGLEYVNDSALSWELLTGDRVKGGFVVALHDEDADEDADEG